MSALVIRPNGDLVEVDLKPKTSHLSLMREHLGCSAVDVVRLTSELDMWIDDEGLYTQPVNMPATILARRYGYTWQPYHGPALVCSVDGDGYSTNMTPDQTRAVLLALEDVADAL